MEITLKEAIEITENFVKILPGSLSDKERAALRLGIEGLKRVKDMRISPCTTADEILPGETEE